MGKKMKTILSAFEKTLDMLVQGNILEEDDAYALEQERLLNELLNLSEILET